MMGWDKFVKMRGLYLRLYREREDELKTLGVSPPFADTCMRAVSFQKKKRGGKDGADGGGGYEMMRSPSPEAGGVGHAAGEGGTNPNMIPLEPRSGVVRRWGGRRRFFSRT